MILEKFTSPLGGKSVNSGFFYYYLMGGRGVVCSFVITRTIFVIGNLLNLAGCWFFVVYFEAFRHFTLHLVLNMVFTWHNSTAY